MDYLEKLSKYELDNKIKDFSNSDIPCFIFSKDLKPKLSLKKLLNKEKIVFYSTNIGTNELINNLNNFLADSFAPKVTFHGVLMDIHRMGVLILGKSGIGKSECSIELIIKGSKLIADDVI